MLENAYLNAQEAGFSQTENKEIQPLSFDQRNEYSELLSSYAQIFVLANNKEIFDNYLTSMQSVKGEESIVLGLELSYAVNVVSHMSLLPMEPKISFVGGHVSAQKLRLIGTLAKSQNVVLLGELGLFFAIVQMEVKGFK